MGVGVGIHFLYVEYIEKLNINGTIKLGQIIGIVILYMPLKNIIGGSDYG